MATAQTRAEGAKPSRPYPFKTALEKELSWFLELLRTPVTYRSSTKPCVTKDLTSVLYYPADHPLRTLGPLSDHSILRYIMFALSRFFVTLNFSVKSENLLLNFRSTY